MVSRQNNCDGDGSNMLTIWKNNKIIYSKLFYGHIQITPKLVKEEILNNQKATAEQLGGMLFSIHHHHPETEKIIYYEEDVVKLLKALGHPEPKFGNVLTIDDFKKQNK